MTKNFMYVLFVFYSLPGISQKVEYNNSVQDLITKSTPQAYQFQKYGDLPVNTNTGAVDISIPMFTVSIKDVDWKVGLSYHSGGVKVSEISGCAGLGWNLLAGGMISSRSYQRSDVFMDNAGDIESNKRTFNLTPLSPQSGEIFTCHYANTADMGFANNILTQKKEAVPINYVPDIFYLNAGSINAKFILKNHKGYCLPSRDLLIDHVPGAMANNNSYPGSWLVVDESGNKFTFEWGGGNATENLDGDIDNPDGVTGTSPLAFDSYTPTYVLVKIENVLGESINFFYTKEYFHYRGSNSDAYHLNGTTQNPQYCLNPINGFLPSMHKSVYNHVIESRLDSIYSSTGESIVFTYGGRNDLPGASRLTKVTKYYRSLTNYHFIKAFELNSSYFGNGSDPRNLRLKLTGITEKGSTSQSGGQYSFEYNNITLPSRISPAQDIYGYYNGQDNNQNLVPVYGGNRDISFSNSKACILEKINYPTGGYTQLSYELKQYGGLRVKSKVDYSFSQGFNYKEYQYSNIYFASGPGSGTPKFSKEINFYYLACATNTSNPPLQINCPATQTYSEPIKSLYESYYGIDNVERYGVVTELFGINGANGKITYHYNAYDPVLNSESGRLGSEDLLLKKTIYKNEAGSFTQVSDETNYYTVLNETSTGLFSNAVNQREVRVWGLDFEQEKEELIGACEGSGSNGGGTGPAMCYPQQLFQVSIRLVSSPIMRYKQESLVNNIMTVSEIDYNANINLSPKEIRVYDSKAGRKVERYKYPTDFIGITSTDPVSQGIKKLLDNHVISLQVEKSTFRESDNGSNSRLIEAKFFTFLHDKSLPNKIYSINMSDPITNFAPASLSGGAVVRDSRYTEKASYNAYNQWNELLELQRIGDIKISYIWGDETVDLSGNKFRIPVASVSNAGQSDVAATSFEMATSIFYPITGSGNWQFTAPAISDAEAPTGIKAYNLSYGAISRTGLNQSLTYIVSYWSKSGPQSVNGTTAIPGRIYKNWTYYEHLVISPASSQITVSGSGIIDELRLYPKGAMMTTYVFDPLIGMKSICDPNNRINYYEYDGLNRLILIRDQDFNITHKYCYNYAGQTENCQTVCSNYSPDWQNTSTPLRCQQSPCGNTGYQEREQKDMNSCSPTFNQLRWVVDNYNPSICLPGGTNPNWQNTSTPLRCQQGTCGNTGYQEQEQQDLNPCSSTYNQTQWVIAGYNPTVCMPANGILVTYQNNSNITGFNVVYTNTASGQFYTFSLPSGSGNLGCIPAGTYTISITKPRNSVLYEFGCGCITTVATSGIFSNVNVTSTSCNAISIGYSF